jgi:hypothetical protein
MHFDTASSLDSVSLLRATLRRWMVPAVKMNWVLEIGAQLRPNCSSNSSAICRILSLLFLNVSLFRIFH